MNKVYQHTQIGYLLLIALGAAILLIIGLTLATGFEWVVLAPLLILAVCLVVFATMTVKVDAEKLTFHFGPGLMRKQFQLADIVSFRAVKNPWYYGWGIHLTPSGWLYNVSGFWAVEIQMKDGKKFRLGTDDPTGLIKAIQRDNSP